VAAIQPDIAQTQKWDPAQGEEILDRLETLTDQAAAEPEPDLVVWPETTTPDSLSLDGLSRALVTNLVHRHGVPLLAGAVHVAAEGDGYRYYNSAFLFTPGEGLAERYDKQHLVPFGEYIPLSGWLPWLERLAPLGWTCAAGRRATVFRLADPPLAFSSLICFEDTVSGLARAFVRRGARVLINQTNDAWFDRTAGPVQHLSQSVFRCVENRVPMVRVANTGITALVDPSGRIRDAIGSTARQTPAAGWRNWAVVAPPPGRAPTAYTRHGDALFGLPCAGVAALAFLLALRAAWRKDSTRSGVVPAAGGTEIP
jgi:apolipoprotein N-acyltransferase